MHQKKRKITEFFSYILEHDLEFVVVIIVISGFDFSLIRYFLLVFEKLISFAKHEEEIHNGKIKLR